MSIGDRLQYARQRAALTGPQVSESTGIGTSSLSDFENDKRSPSVSQLQKLAEVYRRSVGFFLEEGPPPREVILWRKRPDEEAPSVEMQFLKLCEQYHRLEMWCGEVIAPCLPKGSGNAACYTYVDAEALAKQVRDQLELGDRPGLSLLTVLEEVCGVKVFHLDFKPTGTAASTWSDTFGAAVLLNKGSVRWRRNFDLAHELFHLLTWSVFRKSEDANVTSFCASEEEEKLATCFARNLLMPTDVVKKAYSDKRKEGKLSFEAVFDIARQFDVSVEAILRHLSFLGIVDRGMVDNAVDRARLLAPVLEDRQSTGPPTWPERYKALAMKALRHGSISIGKFAEFLEISRHEAMKYVEQEVTDDEEVPVTPA